MLGDPQELSDDEALTVLDQGAPQELSDDEALAFLEGTSPPPQTSKAGALVGGAFRGAAALPGMAKIAAQTLNQELGLGPQTPGLGGGEGTPFFGGIEQALQGAANFYDPPESQGQGGFGEDVARGAGSILGSAPALMAGPGVAALQFGAQTGVPLYYDVKRATGGDENAAMWSLLFGNAVGQLERFGAEKALSSIVDKLAGKGVREAVEKLSVRTALGAGKNALGEAVPGAAQTALEDTIFNALTPEERKTWEDVKRGLPVELLLGGAFGAVDSALSHRAEPQGTSGVVESVNEPGASTTPQATAAEPSAPSTESGAASATPTAPVASPGTAETTQPASPESLPEKTPSVPAQEPGAAPPAQEPLAEPSAIQGSAPNLSVEAVAGGFEVAGPDGEYFTAQKSDEDGRYFASHVRVPPEMQGQGKGAALYEAAAREAERRGSALRSSHELSDAARNTWEALVRAGKAKREGNGYVMQDVPSPAATVEEQTAGQGKPAEKPKGAPITQAQLDYDNDLELAREIAKYPNIRAWQQSQNRRNEGAVTSERRAELSATEVGKLAKLIRAGKPLPPRPTFVEGHPIVGYEGEIFGGSVEEQTAGPDLPQKPEPQAEPTTGIKNRTVEKELEKMGLPPPEPSERVSDIERHAKAKAKFEEDQQAGARLVDELEAKPRPPTGDENALLTFEVNRLINEREAAQDAFNADPSDANQVRIDKATAAYGRTADVLKRSGTESSASLRLRKMMLARDYSLAEMERSFRTEKGGKPLTAEESKLVADLHKKIAAAEKAHGEYVSAAELRKAELEAENATLKLAKEAKGFSRRSKRKAEIEQAKKELDAALNDLASNMKAAAGLGALDPRNIAATARAAAAALKIGVKTFAQFADDMVAKLGEGIRPYLKTAWDEAHAGRRRELAAPVLKKLKEGEKLTSADVRPIAESFVEQGITEREALVDAVHGVLKEADPGITRREAMDAISGYGEYRKLSQDETKKRLRELKGEMRASAKLEDVKGGEKPAQTGFEARKPTRQELKMLDKVQAVARDMGIELKKPRGPSWRVSTRNEVMVEAARLKSKIQAQRTRITNEIADLQERIKQGNFAPKPNKTLPVDEQTVKLRAELETAKREFAAAKETARLANRTKRQKAIDAAKDWAKAPTQIVSAFDVSAPGRQGLFYAVGDAFFRPKTFARQVKSMFQALASKEKATEVDAWVKSHPLYDFAEASKLDLAPMEEEMGSRVAKKVWGVQASNRAFTTFLNLQRMQTFARMVGALPEAPTLAQGREIANLVNIGTGRGNPGKFGAAMQAASYVLWSPRLLLSRLQTLFPTHLVKASPAVRKLAAKEYARFLSGITAVYTLAQLADQLDDEDDVTTSMDARSSDFGKIKIGPVRIDPLGGLAQVTTFVARMVSGEKKSTKGKVFDIRGADIAYGKGDASDVAKDFLRTKVSPLVGAGWDVVTGRRMERDEKGKPLPTTPGSVAQSLGVPISFRDIKSEMEKLGVPEAAAITALQMLGVGVQVYE